MSMEMDRLRFYIEKRMQTIMIGALSRFEENFGHLWGHYTDEDTPLTEAELSYADDWERTRNQILNQGNAQIRNTKEDFDKWGVSSVRTEYNYSFPPTPTMAKCTNNCKCNRPKN